MHPEKPARRIDMYGLEKVRVCGKMIQVCTILTDCPHLSTCTELCVLSVANDLVFLSEIPVALRYLFQEYVNGRGSA